MMIVDDFAQIAIDYARLFATDLVASPDDNQTDHLSDQLIEFTAEDIANLQAA